MIYKCLFYLTFKLIYWSFDKYIIILIICKTAKNLKLAKLWYVVLCTSHFYKVTYS